MYQYVMIGIRYGVYSVLVCYVGTVLLVCIVLMIQCYRFIMEGIIKLFCYGVYEFFMLRRLNCN